MTLRARIRKINFRPPWEGPWFSYCPCGWKGTFREFSGAVNRASWHVLTYHR